MKIAIILVSLFSLSLSLDTASIDLGKKVLFDSSNKEFTIQYKGPQNNMLLFLMSQEIRGLSYKLKCPDIEMETTKSEKENGIFIYNSGGTCTLKFNVNEGDKGNFFVYDFKALYEIKLKNKYGNINAGMEWSSFVREEQYDESMSKLTFLVPNFRANSIISFEYTKNVNHFSPFENPFKVCHENVCKENVTSYYFEKGKSYQIYVKTQKVLEYQETRYAVPPFRFYANDSDEEYSNDDIKYTYNDTKPDPKPHSSSNYSQTSLRILVLLISLLF